MRTLNANFHILQSDIATDGNLVVVSLDLNRDVSKKRKMTAEIDVEMIVTSGELPVCPPQLIVSVGQKFSHRAVL